MNHSSLSRRFVEHLVLVVALTLACQSESPPGEQWEQPSGPALWADQLPPLEWPPNNVEMRVLETFFEVGPCLPVPQGLLVPTGHGVTLIDHDTNTIWSSATPGWATNVVAISDDRLWVADGPAGISVIDVSAGRGRWMTTSPIGFVQELVSAGEYILAVLPEGWLIVLDTDANGQPVEIGRLLLDGTPADLDVRVDDNGVYWGVAARGAGLIRGQLTPEGELTIIETNESHNVTVVAVLRGGNVLSVSHMGSILGTNTETTTENVLPSGIRDLLIDGHGQLWAALGQSGLFLADADGFEAARLIRTRDGEWATAIAPNPNGDTVFVSWRDGVVEELSSDGTVVSAWNVGSYFRIERVSPQLAALHSHQDEGRLWDFELDAELDISDRVSQLYWDGNRTLVAATSDGAYAVERSGDHLIVQRLWADEITGIGAVSDDVIWISSQPVGIGRLSSNLELETWAGYPGPDDRYLGLSEQWVATATWFGADLLAVPTANPSEQSFVRAMLPAPGMGVVVRDNVAVVGLRRWGIASVPLDQGNWPSVSELRLPVGRLWGKDSANRLCATPEGVMVNLTNAGVAVVTVDQTGQLTLRRLIDTPGRAVDCTMTDQPNTYLIADTTALLEIVLE